MMESRWEVNRCVTITHFKCCLKNGPSDSPDDPSKSIPDKTQVTDTIPSMEGSHRPSLKSKDAINTLYLPEKKNDVTCKRAVVSSSDLKEELEKLFPPQEAAIGLKWYDHK